MELFILYIKQHKKRILTFLIFCVIFVITFLLYHLPVKAVLYPTFLCSILGGIILIIDFSNVKYKHNRLCEISELTSAMILEMPEIESIEDKDYQEIIGILKNEVLELINITNSRYQDMVEYYTVWAHQIKIPISSMRLTLQNEDTVISRKLFSELFRIEQYVEMVLTFLRLDSDSSDYIFREYNLDTIIKQSIKRFSTEFIGKKIRLDYEPINETIITDEKWFAFVIEQLLSNALKYTREGSIRIYMRDKKTLCIEDTGIGIAPEDLPRIFEKGYTGYNGRIDKKASGIGLYLCKRICDNLEIKIKAISKVDKGTIIKLNLEQYELKKD